MGNDLDLREMSQICGEMTELFHKRLKNVENDLEVWGNGQNISEIAYVHGARLKYLRNGLTILEMA